MTGRAVITYERTSYPLSDASAGRSAALDRARQAAMARLAKDHPEEFLRHYRAEALARGFRLPALTRACPCGEGRIRRATHKSRWPARCPACQVTETSAATGTEG